MKSESPKPRHIAVIMDGNGRWAKARGLPRVKGHEAGADSVRRIVRECGRREIEALTLYSFSTENWRRPEYEVNALMALLARFLEDEAEDLNENRVQLKAIGELERLPGNVRMLLQQVESLTAKNKGLRLTLALSYGSRAEILTAVQRIATQVKDQLLEPHEISEDVISNALYTADTPDPDLLIRTSGEMRLSNFLLWQLAYTELYVTEVMWPDFDIPELDKALATFGRRERRYGKTSGQLA